MKRQCGVFASLVIFAAAFCAAAQPLDPMVPINPDMADAKTLAADLRMARERWGLRRFILTGPHAVNTQVNKTGVDEYQIMRVLIGELTSFAAVLIYTKLTSRKETALNPSCRSTCIRDGVRSNQL